MLTEIRVPSGIWEALWQEIRRSAAYEPVVFGLVSDATISGKKVVLVKDLIIPPEGILEHGNGHGAKWPPAYNIALINEAVDRKLGVVIFHFHPGNGPVHLSIDDEQSARQLLPAFQLVAPNAVHGSIVLGNTSIAGLVALPGATTLSTHLSIRAFKEGIISFPEPAVDDSERLIHRRRPLVENRLSRDILKNTVVTVVGLSGGGSQVATQLACLGVGEIIGIDSQRVDDDNVKASDEFTRFDVALRRRKTAAVKSKVEAISHDVRFTPIRSLVPERDAITALKRSNIIVGCVNNLHARADIQEIASRYCIPYIDVGLGMFPLDPDDELSEIAAIGGNVFTFVPGRACLWCADILSKEKLAAENRFGNRSYLRTALAEAQGRQRTPYVATFNSVLAGLAVADVAQLLLRYAPAVSSRKQYDAFSGTVSEMDVSTDDQCEHCNAVLAAGDLKWN